MFNKPAPSVALTVRKTTAKNPNEEVDEDGALCSSLRFSSVDALIGCTLLASSRGVRSSAVGVSMASTDQSSGRTGEGTPGRDSLESVSPVSDTQLTAITAYRCLSTNTDSRESQLWATRSRGGAHSRGH